MHPPGVKDPKRFYEANHIAFLANAKAIQSFREHVPGGKIGPSFAYSPAYPASSHPKDILAFENAEEFTNNWWLDVYCWAKYPQVAFNYLQREGLAPTIKDGDFDLLEKGTPDFIGVNYYHTLTYESNPLDGVSEGAFNTTGKKGTTQSVGVPGLYRTARNSHLETSNWDWAIDPIGLRIGLRRITNRYRLPVFITENGLGEFDTLEPGDVINDTYRIAYLDAHLSECRQAITDGVDLIGYCSWSFTDLLSWLNGYQKRYGFVYVNRDETDEKDFKTHQEEELLLVPRSHPHERIFTGVGKSLMTGFRRGFGSLAPIVDQVDIGSVIAGLVRFRHRQTEEIGAKATRQHLTIGVLARSINSDDKARGTLRRGEFLTRVEQAIKVALGAFARIEQRQISRNRLRCRPRFPLRSGRRQSLTACSRSKEGQYRQVSDRRRPGSHDSYPGPRKQPR